MWLILIWENFKEKVNDWDSLDLSTIQEIFTNSIIPTTLDPNQKLLLILCIMVLINFKCFVDILSYIRRINASHIVALYLIKYTNLENWNPLLKKWANYYSKASSFFISLEVLYIIGIHTFILFILIKLYLIAPVFSIIYLVWLLVLVSVIIKIKSLI